MHTHADTLDHQHHLILDPLDREHRLLFYPIFTLFLPLPTYCRWGCALLYSTACISADGSSKCARISYYCIVSGT